MTIPGNYHTHTQFCDGSNTAEEMIEQALQLGFSSLGFSSHCDPPQGVSMDVDAYLAEIRSLQEKYRDKLEILRGVELDNVMSPDMAPDVEYRIGSTHMIPPAGHPAWDHPLSVTEVRELCDAYCNKASHHSAVGSCCGIPSAPADMQGADNRNTEPDCGFLCVDYKPENMHTLCHAWYDGDYYALAADYFRFESAVARRTRPAFIGHFDLVTRFNDLPAEDGGAFLNESDPLYLRAACDAMEQIIRDGVRHFEVNCGATNRGRKKEPYPSLPLLRKLRELGGEMVISSDAHNRKLLNSGFDDALRIVKDCGFSHINLLTRKETDIPAVNTVQDIRFTDGRANVPLYWKSLSI